MHVCPRVHIVCVKAHTISIKDLLFAGKIFAKFTLSTKWEVSNCIGVMGVGVCTAGTTIDSIHTAAILELSCILSG